MSSNLRSLPKRYLIFLIILSLLAVCLSLYTTLPFGAGVSGDAARNMSAAENILRGNGFYDYSRSPFVWWPPLYPLLLAGFSWLGKTDVFLIAWFLNVALAGVNVWLSGILFFRIFQDTRRAYLGTSIVAVSFGMLKLSANVGSDPLFITFVLAFLIYFGSWDGKAGWGFVLLCVLATLASLQRLIGVTLIASAALCILLIKEGNAKHRLKMTLMFSVIAILPLFTWVIGHNYMKHQTLFGPRDYARLPWNNLVDSMEKILNWFYPFYAVKEVSPYLHLVGMGVALMAMVFLYKKDDWIVLGKKLAGPFVLPGTVFIVFYLIVLNFTVNYSEHKYPGYDRFEIVLLPVLIPLIFITLKQFVLSKSRIFNGLLTTLFVLWLGYAVLGLIEFAVASRRDGVVEYNLYNFSSKRNSPTTQKMKELTLANPKATLFSNDPGLIWFVTRQDVLMPPLWEKRKKFNEAAERQFKGWPAEDGYLAWFLPDVFEIFATPQELARVADLELVFRGPDGEIYRVRSKTD